MLLRIDTNTILHAAPNTKRALALRFGKPREGENLRIIEVAECFSQFLHRSFSRGIGLHLF